MTKITVDTDRVLRLLKGAGVPEGVANLTVSQLKQTVAKLNKKLPTSRPARWADACQRAQDAKNDLIEAMNDLKEVQEEYQSWYDNLPDNLQQGAMADKLQEVCNLDLEIEGGLDVIDEAEGVDLPMGFGKD